MDANEKKDNNNNKNEVLLIKYFFLMRFTKMTFLVNYFYYLYIKFVTIFMIIRVKITDEKLLVTR